jgi:hypothetical protein
MSTSETEKDGKATSLARQASELLEAEERMAG